MDAMEIEGLKLIVGFEGGVLIVLFFMMWKQEIKITQLIESVLELWNRQIKG